MKNHSFTMHLPRYCVLPLFLILSACGGGGEESQTSNALSTPPVVTSTEAANESDDTSTSDVAPDNSDIKQETIQASDLQRVAFNYQEAVVDQTRLNSSAEVTFPESESAVGNFLIALNVSDDDGIKNVQFDVSNGNDQIPIIPLCGDFTDRDCSSSTTSTNQIDNTRYRVFVNAINPHRFEWQAGDNTINVWVEDEIGNNTIAESIVFNWQPITVENTSAVFTNESTGELTISWSLIDGYSFYNVYYATEVNVNSDNFSTLADGAAKLVVEDDSVVISGLDTDKAYYYIVTGVDDSGESAFSVEKAISVEGDDVPVADDDIATVNEAAEVTIDVLANDSNLKGSFVITDLTQGANGTVVDNGDGTLTYRHNGGETTSDTFTYRANNGLFDSLTATVTVNITPINDVPVSLNDSATVLEGNNVIIDLRSNDSDEETANAALTLTNIGRTTHGTLVDNGDGTVTYSHNGSHTATDSFTYTVNDGVVDSNIATVSITITNVNDLPFAANDSATLAEGGNVIIDLRGNDSDEETANALLTLTNISSVANGTLINNGNGTVTYTHNGGETSVDSFTYTVNDGALNSNTATVSIAINNSNDRPIAVNDAATVAEGSNVIIDLRGNDSDEETTNAALILTNISSVAHGTLLNNGNGTVTYTHNGSETSADSFTYTVNDGVVNSAVATVSITVNLP